MSSHSEGHSGSRSLCDDLRRVCQEKLGRSVARRENPNQCVLHAPPDAAFAHVYHRKTAENLRVWFYRTKGITPGPAASGLIICPRKRIEKPWEKRFPYSFELSDNSQIDAAAGILVQSAKALPGTYDVERCLKDQSHELAGSGFFDPSDLTDARERVIGSIVRRQGQPAFRRNLLEVYRGKCAVSGCEVEAVLDAAHIVPYRGRKTNHLANGLLLRTDLHTLFDLGLITIDTGGMTVVISPQLRGTCYEQYAGKQITLPVELASRPSCRALDQHRRESGLTRESE
jgi:putative restriction endonuclease